jgi:hypothetical protein
MTDIQICNLALARLGDSRITALTDATAQAQYCSLFYTQTVEELQAEYDWQFCRKQIDLGNSTTAPFSGYNVEYSLPSDFLRVLRFGGVDASENFGVWEIVANKITTNISSQNQIVAVLDYIAAVTDPAKFPALFVELLTIKLAGLLAMPLTGSKDLFGQMAEIFGATMQKPGLRVLLINTQAPKTTTSAANSVTEICRQAILRVGPLEAFKPYGEPMLLAQSLYEQTRDELLADFEWAFTRAQISINKDGQNPTSGYAHKYAIPLGTGKIIRINNIDEAENSGQWEIVGNYIHTNLGQSGMGPFPATYPIVIDYTTKITDVTKFPPIFVQILTTTLALKLCGIIESK